MSQVSVQLDHDVWICLQRLAEPLVDTPSSVIRRLLSRTKVYVRPEQAPITDQTPVTPSIPAIPPLKVGPSRRPHCIAIIRVLQESGRAMTPNELYGAAARHLKAIGAITKNTPRVRNALYWSRLTLKAHGIVERVENKWRLASTIVGNNDGSPEQTDRSISAVSSSRRS